jgi:hypothetical protein
VLHGRDAWGNGNRVGQELLSVEFAVTLVVRLVSAGQDHPSLRCIEACGGAEKRSIVALDPDKANTIGHSSEIAKTRWHATTPVEGPTVKKGGEGDRPPRPSESPLGCAIWSSLSLVEASP